MGALTAPFSTRVTASLVDLATVAATKPSFDVAGSFAIAIRAIASDRLEELNGRCG
jgi:hypothetical protein